MKYAPRKVYIKESGGYVELSYTDFCRRRQADKGYMDKLFIPVQGCLLEVVKTSEDNLNEGVKFHLYGTSLSGSSVDSYATTNSDGIAKFENVLVSGDTPYTLEEVNTADRYVVPKKQTAPIEWNKVTQRSFENVLKKWNLTVTKTDAETKSAQGNSTLAGAIYGIYNDGKLVDKYTTDKNGSFTTSYYVCGDNWTLKEIEPSEGYLLDETEYHIGAEAKKYTLENNSISVKTQMGELDIKVPRDRNGEYEPKIIGKYNRNVDGIEEKILSLYACGMSQRDIAEQIKNLYDVEISPELVSKISEKIMPDVTAWQNRPLEAVYPFVFMDAIHYKVKENHQYITKAAYVVLGINLDGQKDILGIWIGENESSKFWLNVLNELKTRGIKDVFLFCVDGLTGFRQAIEAAFPNAQIQRCIIHQIRSSTRFVSYKHIKELIFYDIFIVKIEAHYCSSQI